MDPGERGDRCARHAPAPLLAYAGVWRVIILFAAALVVANTTGLLPENDDDACVDQGEGQCPPTCPTCPCAWHALQSLPTAAVEITALALTAPAAELPPPRGAAGRNPPPPITRPPIA